MVAHISSILTVDDDPIFQELIKASIAARGIEGVQQAGNESEAIAVINSNPCIDLIVTDLLMPDIDGSDLLRHLKVTRNKTPLIIVSSALAPTIAAVEALAASYELNFLGTLSKPLDFEQFEHILLSAGLQLQPLENAG